MKTAYFLPREQSKEIIEAALACGSNIRCDELNAPFSLERKKTEKTPAQILKIALEEKHSLFHFILRKDRPGRPDVFDVGCSTMVTRPDYFLWIDITPEQGAELIAKYGLELLT